MTANSALSSSLPLSKDFSSGDERDAYCVCACEAKRLLPLKERFSVDKLWFGVEKYLLDNAYIIRASSAEAVDCMKCARHRMTWHAVIYHTCRNSPRNSAEIYYRLLLFLLNYLETNVLGQLLNQKDAASQNNMTPKSVRCGFVRHYRQFMALGRVVLSCFGCLDLCYTMKYGFDSVTAACLKMFYVVVYKPMKKLIVDEVIKLADEARETHQNGDECSAKLCADVQQVLAVILEIIFKVRKYSFSNTEEQLFGCVETRDDLGHNFTFSSRLTEKNVSANDELTWSLFFNPCGSSVEQVGLSEGHSNCYAAQQPDTATSSFFDDISFLREKLERSLYAERMVAGQATTGTNNGCRGGNAKNSIELAGVVIAAVIQPLHLLISAEFGALYASAAVNYYRNRRDTQLATTAGRRNYMQWVQSCLVVEVSLIKEVNVVQFLIALREKLYHVLLVEVHRTIILDKEFGFCAQLDAWDNSRQKIRTSKRLPVVLSQSLSPSSSAEVMTGKAATTFLSSTPAPPGTFLREFSPEELGCRIRLFVTTLVNTQNETCLALLASEFACKMVMDIAALFVAYFSHMDLLKHNSFASPAHTHCRGALVSEENGKPQDCSMTLIEGLVDISLRYSELVKQQFNDHQSLRDAMNDALRVMLNPELWSQPKVQIEGLGPGVMSKETSEIVGELEMMCRSHGLPIAFFFALYCIELCKSDMGDSHFPLVCDCNDFVTVTNHIANLVELLDDKDTFFENYKQLLAHRLLAAFSLATQLNIEKEHIIVCNLQRALGRIMTHPLAAILGDYESNVQLCETFCQTPAYSLLETKVRVQVINPVHWPKYHFVHISPCDSLAHAIKAFTEYYSEIQPLRRLNWIYTLGSAVLHAVFPKGEKKIVSNIIQANILILVSNAYNAGSNQAVFWYRRSLSGKEIAANMGMSFNAISAHLAILVQHEPYNILRRVGSAMNSTVAELSPTADSSFTSLQLAPDDEFVLNINYTHKLSTFKLPAARSFKKRYHGGTRSSFAYEDGPPSVVSTFTSDTKLLQMDAAIVKIMKRSGSLRYNELFEETRRQLPHHFAPYLRNMKKQVENLVARGLLRRSKCDPTTLEYIA